MIIEQPGKVTENIFMLGKQENCVYLVDGGEAFAILGGGLTGIIPDVEAQLAAMEVDPQRIQSLVILHSHFDHCGIVPFFKNKWPWVEIVASERAQTILSNPKAVASIEEFNKRHLTETLPHVSPKDLCIQGFNIDVDRVVAQGDVLACGSLNLEGAFLHVMGDLLGSVAALISGAVILLTGWATIDPLLSLLIVVLILVSALEKPLTIT